MYIILWSLVGHFHFAFDNYDERGRSLFQKINNINDLSILQDIGFNHFGKLGIQRGQKKEIKALITTIKKSIGKINIMSLRHKQIAN